MQAQGHGVDGIDGLDDPDHEEIGLVAQVPHPYRGMVPAGPHDGSQEEALGFAGARVREVVAIAGVDHAVTAYERPRPGLRLAQEHPARRQFGPLM